MIAFFIKGMICWGILFVMKVHMWYTISFLYTLTHMKFWYAMHIQSLIKPSAGLVN